MSFSNSLYFLNSYELQDAITKKSTADELKSYLYLEDFDHLEGVKDFIYNEQRTIDTAWEVILLRRKWWQLIFIPFLAPFRLYNYLHYEVFDWSRYIPIKKILEFDIVYRNRYQNHNELMRETSYEGLTKDQAEMINRYKHSNEYKKMLEGVEKKYLEWSEKLQAKRVIDYAFLRNLIKELSSCEEVPEDSQPFDSYYLLYEMLKEHVPESNKLLNFLAYISEKIEEKENPYHLENLGITVGDEKMNHDGLLVRKEEYRGILNDSAGLLKLVTKHDDGEMLDEVLASLLRTLEKGIEVDKDLYIAVY